MGKVPIEIKNFKSLDEFKAQIKSCVPKNSPCKICECLFMSHFTLFVWDINIIASCYFEILIMAHAFFIYLFVFYYSNSKKRNYIGHLHGDFLKHF